MKRILMCLALTGFLGAPLCAQETPPEGEKEKTTEELLAELHKLMKEASKEMGAAEGELAKASLPASKADIIAARMKEMREKMARGEIDEVPEGLRDYLRDNAKDVASLVGKSEEEFKKLCDDQEKLKELLKKSPDLLKHLSKSEAIMESVLEQQLKVEKKLQDTIDKQKAATDKAETKADEAINVAVKLRSQ